MTISLDAVAPDHHRITGPREPAKLDADHVRGVDRHSWNFGVCGDAVSTVMGALPQGEILDMLVQRRRDTRAALRLMRKLLRKQGFAPKLLVTDKLRSYASAFRRLRLSCRHEQGLRSDNRAENSHQPVRRSRAQDAAVQIGSIRSALAQHACCCSQHLQPSTPSRLAIGAPDLPSRGDERMAERSSGGVRWRIAPRRHGRGL